MGACSQFGIVVHCRTGGMNSVPHWAFTCLHLPQAAAGSALGAAKPPLRITYEGAAAPSYIPGVGFLTVWVQDIPALAFFVRRIYNIKIEHRLKTLKEEFSNDCYQKVCG